MSLVPGSILHVWDYLQVGDYIQSPNKLFFAIMQGDGNFCVYRGSGPEDNHGHLWGTQKLAPGGRFFAILQEDGNFCVYRGVPAPRHENHDYVWGTQKLGEGGKFYLIMQDDGNLCVYKGMSEQDNQGYVWGTQRTDPIDHFEATDIRYDLTAARTLTKGDFTLFLQHVSNDTSTPQTTTISGSSSVAEARAWSLTSGWKANVSVNFSVGIPNLGTAGITLSGEKSSSITKSETETVTRTWTFNTPISVPAHKEGVVLVSITTATISVPFVLQGTVVLKSGTRLDGRQIAGNYTGTNAFDLRVQYQEVPPQ